MNDETSDCEKGPAYTVSVKLSSSAIESMRCMFLHGPTWDGNIPSKAGRDELFDLKLAARIRGYSWLTADGMRLALDNGLDREKEKWERNRRQRMAKLEQIEEIISPTNAAAEPMAPTVQGLTEILQRPEPTR